MKVTMLESNPHVSDAGQALDRSGHPIGRSTHWLLWLLTIYALGFIGSSAQGGVTLTVGPNVNITKSTANNAEQTIAINPLNPNNLFASETWSVATKYSTDGGVTWLNSNISAMPASIGDVSASWDKFGNLFLCELGNNVEIIVGVSTNGGASFKPVYQTPWTFNDQPTIVTGPSSVPGQGSVWINYSDDTGQLVVQGAAVTGPGAVGPFGSVQAAPGPGGGFGDIAVGPNGEVMVCYQDTGSGEGPDTVLVNVDPDGLGPLGFGPVISATPIQVGGFAYITPQPNRSIDSETGLAWDRSGGPHNGRVYLVYTDRPSTSSDDTDIYVRFSDNVGTTWSPRVRVNDDPVGNGKSQLLPKIALDQTSGNIAVCFYDCRNSAGNNLAEFWASVSTDGGQTFLPNVKVSAGASSATAPGTGGFDFGDYTGLAFHAGNFYPCWADNSNSTGDNPAGTLKALDMYTAKVSVSGAPIIASIQPTNLTVLMGQPVTFTVTLASGADPLTYQWNLNGNPIPGASATNYVLAAAQPGDSGGYMVVVTNTSGAATSSVASLTVISTVPLPYALDDTLTWTTDPVSPWYGQTIINQDGVAAAQTFLLADGQQTSLRTTVLGPGALTYWWKVSSEADADILTFSYGGGARTNISGEVDWQQQSFLLPSGSQVLQWTYAKDAGNSAGQDAAWVDQVIFVPGYALPFVITQPTNQVAFGDTPVTFAVQAGGTPTLTYQWRFNGANITGATRSSFTLNAPRTQDAGLYSVQVTNPYGSTNSDDAVLGVVPMSMRGDNSLGQLLVPLDATNAIAVAGGAWHNLALRADGLVLAWGESYDGQSDVPPGLKDVVAIAAGGYHSLALKGDRTVVGWGANYYRQAAPPVSISNIIAIAAGTWHSLGLRANGTAVGWGDNSWSQTNIPPGISNIVAIAAGGNHSLALRVDGTVAAWGENTDSQGNNIGQSVVPPGLSNVVGIAAGDYHSLAVKADGTVVLWGDNSKGQCQAPPNLGTIVAVAGGGMHSVALRANGSVIAWGNNSLGQCNVPNTLSNVVELAAGDSHTVLLMGTPPALPQPMRPARRPNEFSVLLQTYSGRNYSLQYKTSLTAATWTSLPTIHGNGAMQFLIDPGASGPRRFYRVRQF